MKVHKGTNHRGEKVRWIEVRPVFQLELHELIDGLCSEFIRNRTDDDKPLPAAMSAAEIVRVVRLEYAGLGMNHVWTWAEQTGQDEDAAREWARNLVLDAFPELEDKS